MQKLLDKLPFSYKDPVAIGIFVLVVALAVIAAKKLPVLGKQL